MEHMLSSPRSPLFSSIAVLVHPRSNLSSGWSTQSNTKKAAKMVESGQPWFTPSFMDINRHVLSSHQCLTGYPGGHIGGVLVVRALSAVVNAIHQSLAWYTIEHILDIRGESRPSRHLWRLLLLRLGYEFFNGELHSLDNEVHSSFDAHCKEEPLCKAGDGILGDMWCNDVAEGRWDTERP